MSTTIRLKSSGSTGNIPSNSELAFGEVALNYADGILYFKNSSNVVTQISGSGANTFETINANGTLLIPDSNVDILTLSSGNGIHIAGNASSDSLTVSVRFDDTVTSTSTDKAATANSVKTAYDYADSAHLEATSASAEAIDASNLANSAYNQANNAYAKANAPITIKEVYASNNSVVNTFANISTIQFDADSGMAVVDEGNNAVTIQLNSTFKTWNINGGPGLVAFGLDTVNFVSANGITLSANNLSSPKTFKIDATELPNAYAQANAAYGAANNRVLKSGDTMTGQLNISSGGLLVTGDANVSGNVVAQTNLKSLYSVGDEGGEINLNIPQTNTSIAGAVAIDIYQNKLRIFETSGNNRGVYIDFTATPAGVGRDLLAGGPQGPQGYQGFQGATGPQGFQGATGPQGPQGVQGVQGHQGFQGATGPQGSQGVQGSVGAQGHQGVQGEIGAQGVQGHQGVQGATGPQGSQGAQGEIGAQGYQGFQGATGPQGVQGVQGHQGYQGIQGATGPQGFQGVLGAQGHQGVQGSQGVQGETGSFGGATFDYVYLTNTANTNPGTGNLKFDNVTFTSATTLFINDNDISAINVFNYLQTIDDSTSSIKGTYKLANTANILQFAFFNITGLHNHSGGYFSVPTVHVSGVTSFPDQTNTIITFVRTGDRGDTGAQGPQGIQGATGSQGFQGVDGAQGAIGAQGVQGHQGFQGATGPQGSQGLEGAQGPTGVQGAQGATGPQGAQGTDGAQGATGPQGAQGAQGAPGVSPGGTANTVAKFTGATTIADSQIFDNGTNIGFGTTSPNVKVDIIGTTAGSLRLSHDTTNAANKIGRIVGRPYTNADTDFLAFDIRGLSALNEINYGGGSGILNAVQRHKFYIAANNTTLSGTEKVRIDENGIGVTDTTGNIISTQHGNAFTTSAVTSYTVDTFASATFRSAKYFAQMAATTGPTYGAIELNLVHDGTTVYLTQYGENKSNASANLGLFDASITSGALNLTYTPGSVYAAQTVKVVRLAVTD